MKRGRPVPKEPSEGCGPRRRPDECYEISCVKEGLTEDRLLYIVTSVPPERFFRFING
jgi:hypothetical protein